MKAGNTYYERYSLNIARRGQHFARVELNAATRVEAIAKAHAFTQRFEAPEFKLELTGWTPSYGHPVPLFYRDADPGVREAAHAGVGEQD